MKMKIALSVLFISIVLARLLLDLPSSLYYIIFIVIPFVFYLATHDKANTIRFFICCLSILPIFPIFVTPVFYVLSLALNDEYLRKVFHSRIIVFTGIDGSGKSSHSKVTAEYLRSRGIDCVCYHFFKHPLVTALSILKARLKKEPVRGCRFVYTEEFRRGLRRPSAFLRPILQFIDNWIYIGGKILINILRGRWIICDRYFYDYYIRFKCLGYPVPKLLEFLVYKLTPRPSLLIVLDTNPLLSYKRREGEHPLWYYVIARREYLKLAKRMNGIIINTMRPFDVVQMVINKIIEDFLIKK
ncbi:MAG: hypothetical protein GXO26_01120 [Crenarchaeota archaeon]|nr:hypothetical protein [Thermoproteota archaeon]